jgi:hypothetical protein
MTTSGERLAAVAERVQPCPAPDVQAGYDQCAHGTWPCAQTEASWLARGSDRDTEMSAWQQQIAREAAFEEAGREALAEYEAARREGRLPDWEADLEAGA